MDGERRNLSATKKNCLSFSTIATKFPRFSFGTAYTILFHFLWQLPQPMNTRNRKYFSVVFPYIRHVRSEEKKNKKKKKMRRHCNGLWLKWKIECRTWISNLIVRHVRSFGAWTNATNKSANERVSKAAKWQRLCCCCIRCFERWMFAIVSVHSC